MSEGHHSSLPSPRNGRSSRKKKRYPVAQPYAPPPGIPAARSSARIAYDASGNIVSAEAHRPPSNGLLKTAAVVAGIVVVCLVGGWYFFSGPGAAVLKNLRPAARLQNADNDAAVVLADDAKSKPPEVESTPPKKELLPPAKPPEKKPEPAPVQPPMPEKPKVDAPPVKPPEQPKPVNVPPPPPPMPKPEPPAVAMLTFEKDVLPIFQAKCINCHNEDKKRGGLDVTSLAAVIKGGEGGPSVIPGMALKSSVWTAINTNQMPPTPNKLNDTEKKLIQAWIMQGAKGGAATAQAAKP